MQPETPRNAWLRGNEDAVRFFDHGDPVLWRMQTGSDPTENGYAERVFGPLARDWQAGWDHGAILCADGGTACGCQDGSHAEGGAGHTYLGVSAGRDGRLCDPCARICGV